MTTDASLRTLLAALVALAHAYAWVRDCRKLPKEIREDQGKVDRALAVTRRRLWPSHSLSIQPAVTN
jgi:hypothetical protein